MQEDLYPSRQTENDRLLARRDPSVYSTTPPPSGLCEQQLGHFAEQGFLYREALFDAEEIDLLHQELLRLRTSPDVLQAEGAETGDGGDTLHFLYQVQAHSEMLDQLIRDRRILDTVEHLLGGEVYLHQSRLDLKPAFRGREDYWHSDFETWHVEDGLTRMRTVSVGIMLTPNTELNAPLMLVPGSHNTFISCAGAPPTDPDQDPSGRPPPGVPCDASIIEMVRQGGIEAPNGPAGSVLFLDCNTLHGSNSNITPYARSRAVFTYNHIENAPAEPFSGYPPRPGYMAERQTFEPLQACEPDYAELVSR